VADIFYIRKFLDASVHGLVGHMTPDNQDQFKQPLCVVYYKVDWKLNAKGEVYNYKRYFNLIWRTPWDFLRLVFTCDRGVVVVGVVRARPSGITQWCDFAQSTSNRIRSHNSREIAQFIKEHNNHKIKH